MTADGGRERGPRRRGVVAQGTAWTSAVLAAAVTASRWADVAYVPLVRAQSLVPWAAVLASGGLLGVLAPARTSSRAGLGAVCLAVLLVHGLLWLPWLTVESRRPGREVTVMALNVYKGRADLDVVAGLVRRRSVDVLVLSEVTPAAASALRRHDVGRLLPYAAPDAAVSAEVTVLRARRPLVARPDADGLPAAARADHPAAALGPRPSVTVRGVHPEHPATAETARRWRETLRGLTEWAGSTRGPLVVAGDFNATVDHPGLRELLATGLRDAHELAGAGRPPTWPYGHPYPAFLHVDHVLVRGLDVASVDDVRIPGSDHDAVLADLVVPPR